MSSWLFHQPSDLKEASDLLSLYGSSARLLAGGTDLIVQLRKGKLQVEHIISLRGVRGVGELTILPNGRLSVGAMVTVAGLMESALVEAFCPEIISAAAALGSRQVRNVATVGGNLCNASPAADLAPILIALRAEVVILTADGETRLPLEDFFVGPGRTVLCAGQILLRIEIPPLAPNTVVGCRKHSTRREMDLAVVGVAAAIRWASGVAQDVRLVLGAVAPMPMRAGRAEKALVGSLLGAREIGSAADMAAEECRPISDLRASEEYRRQMVRALTQSLLLDLKNQSAPGEG